MKPKKQVKQMLLHELFYPTSRRFNCDITDRLWSILAKPFAGKKRDDFFDPFKDAIRKIIQNEA